MLRLAWPMPRPSFSAREAGSSRSAERMDRVDPEFPFRRGLLMQTRVVTAESEREHERARLAGFPRRRRRR